MREGRGSKKPRRRRPRAARRDDGPAPEPERDLEEAEEERERGLGAAGVGAPSPPLRRARSWWCGDWVRRIEAMGGEVPKMALKPRLGDRGEVVVEWVGEVGEWRGRDGICAPPPSPSPAIRSPRFRWLRVG